MRPGLPLYLGRRWRSRQGDKLILERWTLRGGRRAVHFDDCPECVEGIEVGHGAHVPECLNLARFLVRSESGQVAEAYHANKFADDIISRLPRDQPWSIDACSIRDWVNGEGLVLAHWNRADHWLPSHQAATTERPSRPILQRRPEPVTTPAAATMTDILDTIEGDAF